MTKNKNKMENLEKFANEDYQNRDGNYPQDGVADSISVYKNTLTISFKNTSEISAKYWVESWLRKNNLNASKIGSAQDGDYQDDWVVVYVTIK